jgi:hypothetical protein
MGPWPMAPSCFQFLSDELLSGLNESPRWNLIRCPQTMGPRKTFGGCSPQTLQQNCTREFALFIRIISHQSVVFFLS